MRPVDDSEFSFGYAVTEALVQGADTRSSGLDWVGDVPRHWSIVRLGYLARVSNGSTPSRDKLAYWRGGTIPWLSSGKVNDYIVTEADEYITDLAFRECPLTLLPAESVLVGLLGQGKTRGMCALTALAACINQNTAALVAGARLRPRFHLHVLTAAYATLREDGRGGQQDALNCAIIRAFRIPLPPLAEQDEIVRAIDDETRRIAALMGDLERAIALLREYRQAVITAAVTGKLDIASASKEAA